MRVTVDRDTCQQHGQCVLTSPEVFAFDDGGELAYLSAPDDALRGSVEDAVDGCPAQAIRLEA